MTDETLKIISHIRDGLPDNQAVAGELYSTKDDANCPELLRGWYKAGFHGDNDNPDGATEALFKDKDEAVLWAYFRNHSLELLQILRLMVRHDNEAHLMTLEDINMVANYMTQAAYRSAVKETKCGSLGTDRMGHCLRCGRMIEDLAELPAHCLRPEEMDK